MNTELDPVGCSLETSVLSHHQPHTAGRGLLTKGREMNILKTRERPATTSTSFLHKQNLASSSMWEHKILGNELTLPIFVIPHNDQLKQLNAESGEIFNISISEIIGTVEIWLEDLFSSQHQILRLVEYYLVSSNWKGPMQLPMPKHSEALKYHRIILTAHNKLFFLKCTSLRVS